MSDELQLHRSELLGFAACLYHEMGGVELGIYSPTRILNQRTGRQWTAAQWYALLEPHYELMVNPTTLDNPVHSP
jgi:hypothetical protein